MQKKLMNYSIVAVLLCAIIWTIYSNLFQTKHTMNQSIAIGSHTNELAKEVNTEVAVVNELNNIETHEHEQEETVTDSQSGNEHEGHSHEMNTTDVVDVNNQAPQFITKTLEGETVKLSDFLGKRVILNFWTTWCPPCQEEIPELQKFNDNSNYHDEVVLLGLNITNEDLGLDVIHDFRNYYGITYPILLDETGEIKESYEIITIPTTFIIDEKGNLEKQIIGPLTYAMLNKLLIK